MLSVSSTVIPNSTILFNSLANSQSCHPKELGYQAGANSLILPSDINSSGISNESTPSNLETIVIFKIFDSVIVLRFASSSNKSKIAFTFILLKSNSSLLAKSINNSISFLLI